MTRRLISLFVVGSIVAACASAPPDRLYVRAGLTAEQLAADSDVCMGEARAAERSGPRQASDGSLGGAVASGMAKGASDMDRFMAAYEGCFMRRGYHVRPLTPAQQEEFGGLRSDDERAAYIVRMSGEQTQ